MSVFVLRSRALLLTPILSILLASAAHGALQDEKKKSQAKPTTSQSPATPARSATEPSARRPPRGRLPAYFSAVVSQKQRLRIYEIQKTYNDKIAAMRLQIHQLLTQRDKEVDSVLTTEQLAQVTERRQAAEARRRSRLKRATSADPGGR